MSERPPRIQVKLMLPIAFFIEPRDLVTLAQQAEQAGLDGVTCGELNGVEAFSMLGAVAAATDRLRLETSITAVPTRTHQEILANARCLAALAPDRFTLGLGAGTPTVAAFHHRDFAEPLRRTSDALRELRAALRGDGVSVTLAAVNRGTLRLAGSSADGVILSLLTPTTMVAQSAAIVRERYAEAGRSDPFELTAIQYGAAGVDAKTAERAFRREVAAKYDVPTYRSAALATASESEVNAVMEAWRAKDRDRATDLVPQRAVDALLVGGRPNALLDRLHALHLAGADSVIIVPVTARRATPSDAAALIAALGTVIRQLGD